MALAGDNRCPVCGTALWAPDADTMGSRECPRCGAELWVFVGGKGPMFFVRQPGQSQQSFLAALAAPIYETSAEKMEDALKHADSLDLMEVVMDVEETLRSGYSQKE
jgi:hypothetical protein